MSGPVNLDENIEKINCQTFKTDNFTQKEKAYIQTNKQKLKKTPKTTG